MATTFFGMRTIVVFCVVVLLVVTAMGCATTSGVGQQSSKCGCTNPATCFHGSQQYESKTPQACDMRAGCTQCF